MFCQQHPWMLSVFNVNWGFVCSMAYSQYDEYAFLDITVSPLDDYHLHVLQRWIGIQDKVGSLSLWKSYSTCTHASGSRPVEYRCQNCNYIGCDAYFNESSSVDIKTLQAFMDVCGKHWKNIGSSEIKFCHNFQKKWWHIIHLFLWFYKTCNDNSYNVIGKSDNCSDHVWHQTTNYNCLFCNVHSRIFCLQLFHAQT